MTTTTGTLPLYSVMIQALEDQAVFAIDQAMNALYRTYGDVSGNLRVECVRHEGGYNVTVWRA